MSKLNFSEALDALNDERQLREADIQARALDRAVWVAEWHIPGCMSESRSLHATKADAIEAALSYIGDTPPRGARADLRRFGRTDRVSPDAYVSMAVTTVGRCTLRMGVL